MKDARPTLVLSDIHLGSETSKAKEAEKVLTGTSWGRIILNGDTIDDLRFRHMKEDHNGFMETLKKKKAEGIEIVWIMGNHDGDRSTAAAREMGLEPVNEYAWTNDEASGPKRYIIVHGHEFDRVMPRQSLLSSSAGAVQKLLELVRIYDTFVMTWLKYMLRNILRRDIVVERGALAYAESHGADVVMCGHTHYAYLKKSRSTDGRTITYVNSGDWVGHRHSYVVIDENGPTIRRA